MPHLYCLSCNLIPHDRLQTIIRSAIVHLSRKAEKAKVRQKRAMAIPVMRLEEPAQCQQRKVLLLLRRRLLLLRCLLLLPLLPTAAASDNYDDNNKHYNDNNTVV